MNPRARFEDEADEEYRLAGRWYEAQRAHLGLEFLDAVDETIDRILEMPRSGALVPRLPAELPVRRLGVKRFPYHASIWRAACSFEFSLSHTIDESRVIGSLV